MLLFNKFARFSELYRMLIRINIIDRRRAIYYILSRAIDSMWQSIVVRYLFITRPQNDFWRINYILRETVILWLWVMSNCEALNSSYMGIVQMIWNECRLSVVKMIIRGIFCCRTIVVYARQMLQRLGLIYRISDA